MPVTIAYRPTGAIGQLAAARQFGPLIQRLLHHEWTTARLLRVDGIQNFFGRRWTELEGDLRQRIGDALSRVVGETGVWLPYDESTYLLLPPDEGPFDDDALIEAMGALQRDLVGSALREPLLSVWVPQGPTNSGGWTFLPLGGKAPAEETSEEESERSDDIQPTIDGEPAVAESAATNAPKAKGGQVVYADIELYFVPVWEIRGNRVFAYLCEPEWLTPEGSFRHHEAVDGAFKSDRARLVVDLTVLHKTREAFEDLQEHDRLSSIILPVHYDTLADAEFGKRYLNECQAIVGAFHQYVCFEIISPPERVDRGAFSAVTAAIRPFCRALFVRLPVTGKQVADVMNPDVFALSVDLRDDERPEADIIDDLKALQDQLKDAGGGYSCAHGLASKSLSVAAICEGFDLIGSDVIATALEGWPMDDYMVKPIDLYAHLLKS